ncbi:MAG: ribonuclease PH [Verrucomicrobiota bacterium]
MDFNRPDHRSPDQLRPLSYHWDHAPNALASILIKCGNTQIICSASLEEKRPRWKEAQGLSGGWLTAEYSMLPYSTTSRKTRDISRGKIDGRSQEIQRLIGRSLRAVTDLELLGPRTLWIDCDVLAADGGTRTSAITGGFLALQLAVERLQQSGQLADSPLKSAVAATSVGIYLDQPVLDLCYIEDRDASVDMNVVMTRAGEYVELGATGEEATFSGNQLKELLKLSETGITSLFQFQQDAWSERPKNQ